ncbi:MAG: hypothetical protein WC551_03460 [Patescibacteria group bacterium]
MQSRIFKFLALLTAIFVVFNCYQPTEAQAKVITTKKPVAVKKPVKAVVFKAALKESAAEEILEEPVSRCLTQQIKNLNVKGIKQMEADIAKRGKGHEKAVEEYRYRLNMAWEAMSLPYCGYGSKTGLADEVHSFKKSLDRARADFLKETK